MKKSLLISAMLVFGLASTAVYAENSALLSSDGAMQLAEADTKTDAPKPDAPKPDATKKEHEGKGDEKKEHESKAEEKKEHEGKGKDGDKKEHDGKGKDGDKKGHDGKSHRKAK